jgi:hypothetical protein
MTPREWSMHPTRFALPVLLLLACDKTEKHPDGAASGAGKQAPTGAAAPAHAPAVSAHPSETHAAAPAAVPSNVPSAAASANVTMNGVTADGLKAKELSCHAGGGIFAGTAIVGALAKQKAALAACAKSGEDVRIHFEMAGGKASDVRVAASTPEIARCVADAVSAAAIPDKGECVLTLHVGPG